MASCPGAGSRGCNLMLVGGSAASELIAGGVLTLYTFLVIQALSDMYAKLVNAGIHERLAIYLNRKLVHAAAAGMVTVLTPILFNTPYVPAALSYMLAAILALSKKMGGMRWFQTKEDNNEITFSIAWGSSLLITWFATGSMLAATLPPLYISVGDAVTGFTRAAVIGRREKHWIGNLAMSLVTIPAGYAVLGPAGVFMGAAAAIAERIDKPVDDNIAVAAVTTIGVIAAHYMLGR